MQPISTASFPINKLLVANRGEIAIRIFRAATELQIKTVALYTWEDRYSLHRFKADEAYKIGEDDQALSPYLDMQAIVALALKIGAQAIHPGYGFLSENVEFARLCREKGIIFVGPDPEVMAMLGDKIASKIAAKEAGVPLIEDSQVPLTHLDTAISEADRIGYPVIIKSSAGGGGRGMRVVRSAGEMEKAWNEAGNEAKKAFGDDTRFIEKYIQNPKHIEVQIMGDRHGNLVHLHERDCSVQRRFQKVVEVAPAPNLKVETRQKLHDYAVNLGKSVGYNNVGTVEFLVDETEKIYFIEVNPRIQVEHTITEEITRVDLVRSQILIAMGLKLSDKEILITRQEDVTLKGFAIQCRITTEDPENGFKPDTGTIIAYRNAAGYGLRLDEGSCYPGMKITPFFDSLLVKVSASGRTLEGTIQRLKRALSEFRIRGVKTNIGFLENVIKHPEFTTGRCTVGFIDNNPELFSIPKKGDRGTRMLKYLAGVSVNGHPDIAKPDPNKVFKKPIVPPIGLERPKPGTKQKLTELGPDGFAQWLKAEKAIYYTDTSFRDGHQSLLATRVRGKDLLEIAPVMAHNFPNLLSMEVWGGATFDVALRFLHECPWERLRAIREAIPNILLQMLFRGSNGVGYKAYPDNVIASFIEKSAANGVDIFRIFDSLNWIEELKPSIKAVRERTQSLAEAAICYTGDMLAPGQKKYTLTYYIDLAKRLEDAGAHILAIKDMAGLLKPYAAEVLVSELKQALDIPVHLHTHDTAGIQSATYLKAIEAGVDAIDVAVGAISGLTSQPSFNSIVAMMEGHERENPTDLVALNSVSNYWERVRAYYYPFESGMMAGSAEVYIHEIPGGQYTNLQAQAQSLGLEDRFEEVKLNYKAANLLLGDIVKVTPSSKVVGDLALFMTTQNLTADDVLTKGATLSFPDSVKGLLRGEIGQPEGGFPPAMIKAVLGDEEPYRGRPNAYLKPTDLDEEFAQFQKQFPEKATFEDFLSFKMYPKVFEDYYSFYLEYGPIDTMPTPQFYYAMSQGQEIQINIGEGKDLLVKFINKEHPDDSGMVRVTYELNGQVRRIRVKDQSYAVTKKSNRKAVQGNILEIGSPLQGKIASVVVKIGDLVQAGTALFTLEAMKMESTVLATSDGKVKQIWLQAGALVEADDLVIELE